MSSDTLLATGPSSAGLARGAVDELGDRLEPSLLADVRLLVSELVANGVRHGPNMNGEEIRLQLSISDEQARAEVHDEGHGFDPSAAVPARPEQRLLAGVEPDPKRPAHVLDRP